ncbi:hypothetical protein [Litoribacter ruber]|nr:MULTISPECIES: hypothetical protein [Litoribacter]
MKIKITLAAMLLLVGFMLLDKINMNEEENFFNKSVTVEFSTAN